MELFMTARHFDQSPDLYGPIAMRNPATDEVTRAFRAAATEVADIFASHDLTRFRALFDEVRQFLGGFTHEALEQTSFLIDRLVERQ
jgi:chorismate mutase/prephenate dehydrogenase